MKVEIHVDMHGKCFKCFRSHSSDNSYCMKCISDAVISHKADYFSLDRRDELKGVKKCTCHGHDGEPYLHEVKRDCPNHGGKNAPFAQYDKQERAKRE